MIPVYPAGSSGPFFFICLTISDGRAIVKSFRRNPGSGKTRGQLGCWKKKSG